MKSPTADVAFVVVEPGAEWPDWVADRAGDVDDIVVVAAEEGQAPAELALRVIRRIAAAEHVGLGVRLGVLAAADGVSDDVFAARCLIARAFLSHMAPRNCGEMVLCARDGLRDDARHELMALANTLTDQLFATGLTLVVRFGKPEPELRSGVRLRATEPPVEQGAGGVPVLRSLQ